MTVHTPVLRFDGAGLCTCRHHKSIPLRDTARGDESRPDSIQAFSITKIRIEFFGYE